MSNNGLREPRGDILIVSPHQDDETLAAGAYAAIKALDGYRVNFLLLSDGSASYARQMLRYERSFGGETFEPIDLTTEEFIEARDREFLAATRALTMGGFVGKTIIPENRAVDGQLAISWARTQQMVRDAVDEIGADRIAEIIVPSPRDPHPDHSSAARFVAGMQLPIALRYCMPLGSSSTYTYEATNHAAANVYAAAAEYARIDYSAGRYGIGALSVGRLFDQLRLDPTSLVVP